MKRLLLFVVLASISAIMVAQVGVPQIPLTGNIGAGGIFPVFNNGTIVFASDADHTMVYPEMSAIILRVTSSVSLTSTRKLIAPIALGFTFTVSNATTGGQSIAIIGATGGGVVIGSGQVATVYCDGTNYVSGQIYPPAGVPTSTGSAWGSSYQVGTDGDDLVQLTEGAELPAVSGVNLIDLNGAQLQNGTVSNSALAHDTVTIDSVPCTLGSSCVVGGAGYTLGGTVTGANVALGSGAGTGATVTIIDGLDGNHVIQITTGSSPVANSTLYTFTYTASRGHTSYCIAIPGGQINPPANQGVVIPVGISDMSYRMAIGSGGPLTASTIYTFYVSCP